MIDAHIHLFDPVFSADLSSLLDRARATGIKGWLSNSVDLPSWERTLFLSILHQGVFPAFGIHPWQAEQALPDSRILSGISESAVAVGEIGLDSHCPVPMPLQLQRFREQLQLAREWGVPVVVHARAPWPLVLEELRLFPCGGMVHNFTGSFEVCTALVELGFLVSFGTALLRRPGKKILDSVSRLPAASLLVETDAPAMPFEQSPNVPESLSRVVAEVARIRGATIAETGQQSEENFYRMLGRI